MGILQTLLDKKDEVLTTKEANKPVKAGTNNTADDILRSPSEVERLSQYIEDKSKKKVINLITALRHGVNKIGTKNDINKVLKSLLSGATMKAKKIAAKVLVNKWAKENLIEEIKTKSGKELIGKMISKNIYIKEVVYQRAGKTVSYLQARNILTGRIVSMKTASKLLGKLV